MDEGLPKGKQLKAEYTTNEHAKSVLSNCIARDLTARDLVSVSRLNTNIISPNYNASSSDRHQQLEFLVIPRLFVFEANMRTMPSAKRKRPVTRDEGDAAPRPKRAFGNNASTTQNIPPRAEAEGKATDLEKSQLGSKEDEASDGTKAQECVLLQNTPSTRPRRETQVLEDADGKTWICICRSVTDLGRELDAAEYNRIEVSCAEEGKCVCMQAADAHPNHPWIVTKAGYDLFKEWTHQMYCRDPENFGMYITSKWDGYGASEVVENMFLAFNKEVKKSKKKREPLAIWSHIEGMALFLDRACCGFHGMFSFLGC